MVMIVTIRAASAVRHVPVRSAGRAELFVILPSCSRRFYRVYKRFYPVNKPFTTLYGVNDGRQRNSFAQWAATSKYNWPERRRMPEMLQGIQCNLYKIADVQPLWYATKVVVAT